MCQRVDGGFKISLCYAWTLQSSQHHVFPVVWRLRFTMLAHASKKCNFSWINTIIHHFFMCWYYSDYVKNQVKPVAEHLSKQLCFEYVLSELLLLNKDRQQIPQPCFHSIRKLFSCVYPAIKCESIIWLEPIGQKKTPKHKTTVDVVQMAKSHH